ncbi:MAG: chromate transporter [Oscillospiraceae bacterium]|nr:chromate transporter [Oscillospiraceae bacterium]
MEIAKILLHLFYEFFKTGLFSVGGGLATLPFLRSIADRYDWFDVDEITDMIAISESTPGPIGINMSTYAGFHSLDQYGIGAGMLGAAVATLSIILPSIIVILIISSVLEKFKTNTLVQKVFFLLRPASAGLILGAMFDIFLMAFFNTDMFAGFTFSAENIIGCVKWIEIVIFILMFLAIKKFDKLHPIFFIGAGAVLGIIFSM